MASATFTDTSSQAPTTICVFCGSSSGKYPAHQAAARDLGRAFAKHNIKLVYGGGTVGLMGELARTLVSLAGPDAVHGVIPQALVKYEAEGRPIGKEAEQETAAVGVGASGETVQTGEAAKRADATTASTNSTSAPSSFIPQPVPSRSEFGRTTVVGSMHDRKQMMAKLVIEGGPGSGFIGLSGGYGTIEEVMEMTTWNQLGIHSRGICLYNVDGYWDGLMKWVGDSVKHGFVSEKNAGIMVSSDSAEGCVEALKSYKLSDERFRLDWEKK